MLACLNYWADRHRPFWAVFYTRGRGCFISFFFHFFSISKFSNYVLIYRKKGRLLFLYTRRKYRSSSAHHKMVMHPFYRGRKIKDWSKMFDRKQYRVSNLDLQLKITLYYPKTILAWYAPTPILPNKLNTRIIRCNQSFQKRLTRTWGNLILFPFQIVSH